MILQIRGDQPNSFFVQFLPSQFEVRSDIGEDCGECSDTKRIVLRNRQMMFTMLGGRESKMAARLASD